MPFSLEHPSLRPARILLVASEGHLDSFRSMKSYVHVCVITYTYLSIFNICTYAYIHIDDTKYIHTYNDSKCMFDEIVIPKISEMNNEIH